MKKMSLIFVAVASLFLFSASNVAAHCEIPCGIYDDPVRLSLINEHIVTIEKSMNKINALKGGEDLNQQVRWINNKENHANELQEIVTQYFMTQRIKLDAEKYNEKLGALHKLLIYSMKAKQSTDLANVEKLKAAAKEFHDLYSH